MTTTTAPGHFRATHPDERGATATRQIGALVRRNLTHIKRQPEMLTDDEDDKSTYEKKGTDELDGDDVVKVESTDPEDGSSMGYVLADGPHYLVKIERTEGEEQGSVTFSDFDEDVDVEAPADDEVVDLNSLG